MLLGRTSEQARVDQLLDATREGISGALVFRGEPGIGKTALLDYAAERAEGMVVLRARGVESESELPFSGLSALIRSQLHRIDRIPRAQSEALSGALAIGPPAAADRFAVCAGTLSILAAAAEHGPLLVVIDDVQWIDGSSADALSFTARRIEAEGIAMLFAERVGEGSTFEGEAVEAILLGGLDAASSEALLTGRGARPVAPEVVDRLVTATRGNPLALLEMGEALTDEQLSGTRPLDDQLPVGEGFERAFQRRARGLDADAKRALVVVAASGTGELEEVARALGSMDLDVNDLDPAEERGIIDIQGERIEWRHPLYRAAAYQSATAALRRRAHRAIAETLTGSAAQHRRAWHRAAATVGADEGIAADLERAGRNARRRLGHAEAARAFERAAGLSADPELRARRLLEMGRDLLLLGRLERAIVALEEAVECTSDPLLRAEIQHQRGSVQMWAIGPRAARVFLVEEASRIEDVDPDRAAMMLAEASVTYTMSGEIEASLRLARRAEEVAASASESVQIVATAIVGGALVLRGNASEGRSMVLRTREVFDAVDPLDAHTLVHPLAHVAIWLEEYEVARHVLERVVAAGRQAGAIGLLAYPLACLSELEFRVGRWSASYSAAYESVQLTQARRLENQLSFSLACLAMIEAGLGREPECRAHAAEAWDLAERFGADSVLTYAHAALAFLELGLSRPQEAIEHLEKVASLIHEHGVAEPGVVEWAPNLIAANVWVGRIDDAQEVLSDFEAMADRTGRVSALAAAAGCRGLLAPSRSFERHFDDAFRLLDGLDRPFERARTELQLGQRLRRERRPAEAREPLRRALGTFESLGARPWAERAQAELVTAGGERRAHATHGPGIRALSAQELQISLLVARGLTNREVGEALFLSPKTIEFHLGKIYRKVGVRSRTELASVIARRDEPAEVQA
jgi:DNA-binding CsgD family transcriptional regulator